MLVMLFQIGSNTFWLKSSSDRLQEWFVNENVSLYMPFAVAACSSSLGSADGSISPRDD